MSDVSQDQNSTAEDSKIDDEVIVVDGKDVLDALPKTSIARFDPVKKILASMEEELKDYKPDLSTKVGEKKAREYRSKLVKIRTGAKKIYDTLNAPMLEAQRSTRELVKTITEAVEKFEKPIDAEIERVEEARKAEQLRLEELNKVRVEAIRKRIKVIADLPAMVAEMDAESIATVIEDAKAMPVNEERFAEFLEEAKALIAEVLPRLEQMHASTSEREAQAAELQRQRDEALLEQKRIADDNAAREKLAAIRAKISAIQSSPMSALGKMAAEIEAIQAGLSAPTASEFGDLFADAQQAHQAALQQLGMILGMQRTAEQLKAQQDAAEAIAKASAQEMLASDQEDAPAVEASTCEQEDGDQIVVADVAPIASAIEDKTGGQSQPNQDQLDLQNEFAGNIFVSTPDACSNVGVEAFEEDADDQVEYASLPDSTSLNIGSVILDLVAKHFGFDERNALNMLRELDFDELDEYVDGLEIPL